MCTWILSFIGRVYSTCLTKIWPTTMSAVYMAGYSWKVYKQPVRCACVWVILIYGSYAASLTNKIFRFFVVQFRWQHMNCFIHILMCRTCRTLFFNLALVVSDVPNWCLWRPSSLWQGKGGIWDFERLQFFV